MADKDELVTLVDMEAGESGIVEFIQGGFGLHSCLTAMEIAVGRKVNKISPLLVQGPVTVEVENVQVAIGFGMASRIMVRKSS